MCVCVYYMHTHMLAHVYYIYTYTHACISYTKHSALYLMVMKYLFVYFNGYASFYSSIDHMSLFSFCIYQQPDPYGTEEM